MKYLSLFTGIGGFEYGIQNAYRSKVGGSEANPQGTEGQRLLPKAGEGSSSEKGRTSASTPDLPDERPLCIGYSEIDKYAIQIYQRHFPNHKNYGDITKIDADALPDFDLLCGGFPCQAFSIAGKRRGFEDTRGTLFFDIARILRAKRPRLLVLENVKGLLSHNNGETFRVIISTLDELGYDLQWQVLNSKNFGVPQNRERVLIVGHLRGTSRPQVFPIGESSGNAIESQSIIQINQPRHSNDRVYGDGGVSPTLNTMQGGRRQPKIVTALDASYYKGVGVRGNKHRAIAMTPQIRRLTPTECERLQGFPDGWTEGVSDTQRYKTLGNAVTTNVIQAVMEKLL